MAKSDGSFRMNISVSTGLKKEMDAVPEEVNWSAVAAEAFRSKLLELKSQRKGQNMKDVIERLKAAKELEDNESYNEGLEWGESWAKEAATPKELKRISEASQATNRFQDLFRGQPDHRGWAGVVAQYITGNDQIDGSEINDLWQAVLDDDSGKMDDEDFAWGFMDGALQVWHAVAGKV